MKKNIDVVKIVSIAGTVLGLTASLINGWSQQKNMEKSISEKVNEVISNK